jgi:hypothetical protein
MKRNWIRRLLGGLSLTSALFIFQACYGSPQDFDHDVMIEGQVKSEETGLPVKGIKVSVDETEQYQLTNDEGKYSIYAYVLNDVRVRFEDIDSIQNGNFHPCDTLLSGLTKSYVRLDVLLKDK